MLLSCVYVNGTFYLYLIEDKIKQVRQTRCGGTLINRHVGQLHHLTVVGHADIEALLEAAVLAFVTRLLVNATVKITVIVHQL